MIVGGHPLLVGGCQGTCLVHLDLQWGPVPAVGWMTVVTMRGTTHLWIVSVDLLLQAIKREALCGFVSLGDGDIPLRLSRLSRSLSL